MFHTVSAQIRLADNLEIKRAHVRRASDDCLQASRMPLNRGQGTSNTWRRRLGLNSRGLSVLKSVA
jgi:hypothetical protein